MEYIIINKYDIFLDIDLKKIIYKGYVKILVNLLQKTNLIKINALDFVIKSIVINDDNYDWKINDVDETIEITDDNVFEPNNDYLIKIEFDWKKISS